MVVMQILQCFSHANITMFLSCKYYNVSVMQILQCFCHANITRFCHANIKMFLSCKVYNVSVKQILQCFVILIAIIFLSCNYNLCTSFENFDRYPYYKISQCICHVNFPCKFQTQFLHKFTNTRYSTCQAMNWNENRIGFKYKRKMFKYF